MAPNAKEIFATILEKYQQEKRQKEKEKLNNLRVGDRAFEIANSSPFGWITESCYNDTLFESSDVTKWYEKAEESPAKKQKRLREAERAAARRTGASSSKLFDDDCDDDEDDDY